MSSQRSRRQIRESSDDESMSDNNDTATVTGGDNDNNDDVIISPQEDDDDLTSLPPTNDNDDNDNDDDNDDEEERTRKERRKRIRLTKEVRNLREEDIFFPSDEQSQNITAMTNDDDDSNHDSDDGDDDDYQQDGEEVTPEAEEEARRYLGTAVDVEEEEEGEGEDLLENIYQDYQPISALDTYGREGIDDKDYGNIGYDERAAAESEIDKRYDETRQGMGGRGGQFLEGLMDIDEDDEARRKRRSKFTKGRASDDTDDEQSAEEQDIDDEFDQEEEAFQTEEELNLEAFDVPLREWIAQERTRREVMRKFRRFLMTFVEDDDDDNMEEQEENRRKRKKQSAYYEDRIHTMCSSNLSTLEISYIHLMQKQPTLAIWLVDAPRDMFDILNEAATRHTFSLFKSYGAIQDEIHVRVSDLPIMDSLRALRRTHLDRLVKVNGVVTRRSSVYPQLKLAYYECIRCKDVLGPYRVEESSMIGSSGPDSSAKETATLHQPTSCSNCESEGPFRLSPTKSEYRNYQRMNLQETPGSVPPGRVPRTKEVILTNDLIDIARPGEEVEITGVFAHSFDYNLTQKSGFPVFSTFIGANHIRRREDASSSSNLTEADKAQILELARDPKIGERIVESIAPSIYGHRHVKMALAMALFGAVPKNVSDKHRIRGDINVLLLGDPGTAKSQMLKYAESTAPRAVYSTGKGASAVGLTASVHKDPLTKEWTLEGGALVLADRGVCLIDEFDKMNEQDRTSIHEAMEQQSISVSKAGIVTSLQARCSVIAAANPIGGRYDSSCTFSENVELTDPILQRFDLLCVLQDTVDPVADERLASFVTGSHMRSVATSDHVRGFAPIQDETSNETTGSGYAKSKIIPQNLLRKYIQYARTNVKPILRGNTFDQEKIASLYVALRRESATSGGVPIAVRHIESIMRLSEAHAKMHLREYVRDDDMDASIGMMLQSFITAQKFSVRRQLQRSFAKYISSGEDKAHLLLHILQDMMRNEQMYQVIRLRQRGQSSEMLGTLEVPLEEFEGKARDRRIYDVTEFCAGEAFRDAGYVLDQKRGVVCRQGNDI